MSRLGSLRSGPFGVRSFRLLAGGQFTSTIGDYCYAVGGVLAVSALGGLTQREFREFGAREEVPAAGTTARSAEIKKAAT